jgi:GGDEF domain-containing protein
LNPVTKFFGRGSNELPDTLLLVIGTLLDVVQSYSVVGNAAEHERFSQEIAKLRRVFEDLSPMAPGRASVQCAEILLAVGGIKRAIEEYNEQMLQVINARTTEFQKILTVFADTVETIAWANDGTLTRLRDLKRQTAKALMPTELRTACLLVKECLDCVRQESISQREQAKQAIAKLRYELDSRAAEALAAATTGPRIDSLSGLPTRSEAELAISLEIQSGKGGFAVVFAVERVNLINARFGYAVGDQILQLFRQHLAENLGPADRLFRWSGPVFLALLDRSDVPEQVRAEVKRITAAKLETTVQIGARSVLLPVSSISKVVSLFHVASTPDLIEDIDNSVAETRVVGGNTERSSRTLRPQPATATLLREP